MKGCVALLVCLAATTLSSCGSSTTERTERTVVVNPQTGETTVVPPEGHPYKQPYDCGNTPC